MVIALTCAGSSTSSFGLLSMSLDNNCSGLEPWFISQLVTTVTPTVNGPGVKIDCSKADEFAPAI